MNVRILMVGVSGLVLAACTGTPGSSTGSSTVDGVNGSLGSASARGPDGGRDESGDDEHKGDAATCKSPDGGPSPCAPAGNDDNGNGDEHKGDASTCKAPDGGRSPCAQGAQGDDDDSGDMDNGDDEGRKDGGRRDGGGMN